MICIFDSKKHSGVFGKSVFGKARGWSGCPGGSISRQIRPSHSQRARAALRNLPAIAWVRGRSKLEPTVLYSYGLQLYPYSRTTVKVCMRTNIIQYHHTLSTSTFQATVLLRIQLCLFENRRMSNPDMLVT